MITISGVAFENITAISLRINAEQGFPVHLHSIFMELCQPTILLKDVCSGSPRSVILREFLFPCSIRGTGEQDLCGRAI
jgi:hypothetical protein